MKQDTRRLGELIEKLATHSADHQSLADPMREIAAICDSGKPPPLHLWESTTNRFFKLIESAPEAWARDIFSLTQLEKNVAGRIPKRYHDFLGAYAAEHPEEETERNKAFFSQMLFHHYLWQAEQAARGGDFRDVIAYIKSNPTLRQRGGGSLLRTIVLHFLDIGVIPTDDWSLRILARDLGDPRLAAELKERLKKDAD